MLNTEKIVKQFGTPTFVFDETALASRMREAKAIVGSSVHLCYSIKANPFLIPAMSSCVELLEVCSPGELEICHALGVHPDKVLFSGVNKTREDVERAMDLGVTRFTCESLLHVQLIDEAARARGRVYPVLLRLTAGTQFGMDESDLLHVIDKRDELSGLRIEGIHFFSGTQRKKLDSQKKELLLLENLIQTLKNEHGFDTRRIEYGPGLYFPYFVSEDNSDTLAPLRELAPDLQRLAKCCELTIEMGRFFTAECGTYLTRVIDTKTNCGLNYAIVDGGVHHVNYLGGNMGMRVPHIVHIPGPQHQTETPEDWRLCGSLCTTSDVLVRKIEMNGLAQGDILAFENIGAYSVTEGPALFLSRDMPRIVMHNEDGDHLVRDTIHAYNINRPL